MISRRALLGAGAAVAWIAGLRPCRGAGADWSNQIFRVATSSAMLADVNENDARAALHSWADVISGIVGMRIEYDEYFLCSPSRLSELMRKTAVDSVACTSSDYTGFAEFVDPAVVLVPPNGVGYKYVLLVNGKSNIRRLADLRGRSLAVYRHVTMSLAMNWLFQTTGFIPRDVSALRSAVDLVKAAARLRQRDAARKG